ncbi:Uncharacterised protein [Mycobacterium tuberculosis]|nr:Uncharacterised protein [Mycobacterium tuberculosis]
MSPPTLIWSSAIRITKAITAYCATLAKSVASCIFTPRK